MTIARDGQAAAVDRAYANALTVCTGHVNFLRSKGGRGKKEQGSEAVRARGIALGKPQDMFASCPGEMPASKLG